MRRVGEPWQPAVVGRASRRRSARDRPRFRPLVLLDLINGAAPVGTLTPMPNDPGSFRPLGRCLSVECEAVIVTSCHLTLHCPKGPICCVRHRSGEGATHLTTPAYRVAELLSRPFAAIGAG